MTYKSFSYTGGARIGWMNATWPLAKLNVSSNMLDINATLLGKYSFSPDQVVGIERYTVIPIIGWGIRIHHNIASYPEKVIFWCLGNPNTLIKRIEETGFVGRAITDSLLQRNGMPVRWQFLAAAIVLWNLLFLIDIGFPPKPTAKPGWFSFIAVLILFLGSISMWHFSALQRLVLKHNRDPGEIKAWLYLLAFISGVMSLIMFVVLVNS